MATLQQAHEHADTTFDVLAHHRRRHALESLRECEGPLSVAELADEVAVRETDAPLSSIPADEVTRIFLSLHHTHLPKLADAKHVRFSHEHDSVTLIDQSERFERLRTYLENNHYGAE